MGVAFTIEVSSQTKNSGKLGGSKSMQWGLPEGEYLIQFQTMKFALLPFLFSSTLAFSHPDRGAEPGHDITKLVRTGNGCWTYDALPGWGKLPDGKAIGPTHGSVVIDPKTGLTYVSTDASHGILVCQPDGMELPSIAPGCQGIHAMEVLEKNGVTIITGAQLGGSESIPWRPADKTAS